jgi:hypothetical protein
VFEIFEKPMRCVALIRLSPALPRRVVMITTPFDALEP